MSEQRENRFDPRRDGLGILLFTPGAFFAVLIVLALANSEPLEQGQGTAALARLWAVSIGLLPALLFCGGCAFLGAHLFLVGSTELKRRAGGLVLVSLASSVLLGAFSASAGGLVGDFTTGTLTRALHPAVGASAGLVVFALAVWMAWIRPARPARKAVGSAAGVSETRASASPSHVSEQGVTAAEAAALIPGNLPSWQDEARKEDPLPADAPVAIPAYREDRRRRGEIPEGARPLHPPHDHTLASPGSSRPIDEPSNPSVQHWAPADEPGHFLEPAGEDLAQAEELRPFSRRDVAVEGPSFGAEIEEELTVAEDLALEPVDEALVEDEPPADELLGAEEPEDGPEDEEEAEDVEPEAETAEVLDAPAAAPDLRPSWEQPSLFEVGEEPVDAYGTPVSVVESVLASAEEKGESDGDREVVLEPARPPPKKEKKKKQASSPGVTRERSDLLTEVGCLLVDRGRVAVSMLQKQYDMDFEEATAVLDELQVLGLIGPYLGGQRRDILLTRDEWLEKVSSL